MEELIKEFNLSAEEIKEFDIYKDFLEEKNKVMNLTSITGLDIYIKHFYDSLILYKVNDEMNDLVDVGSGAGFPGVPYAIKNKKTKIILVEPIKKRCVFLNELKDKLQLQNVEIINNRIEDETIKCDNITCRAVSKINILLELLIPRLNVGGTFYCLKGQNYQEELQEAKQAIKELNVKLEHIYHFNLPNNLGERVVITFKKEKETKPIYPRRYANILKKPL